MVGFSKTVEHRRRQKKLAPGARRRARRQLNSVRDAHMRLSDTEARVQKLWTWREEAAEERIARGSYGVVFRAAGAGCAIKEVVATSRARVQAYREHVVGLLQTLLVLRGITAALPLHYGADVRALVSGALLVRMHMELFDGSLESAAGAAMLRADPASWPSVLFQVCAALHALGHCFGVAHNDLYPRNVLLRRGRGGTACFRILGREFRAPFRLVAGVTDFGVCSSPSLALGPAASDWRAHAPEMAARLRQLEAPADLAATPLRAHVLQYCRALPPFARDVYALLAWTAGPSASAPPVVRTGARRALKLLDSRRALLTAPGALLDFIESAFGEEGRECFALGAGTMQADGEDELFELRGDEGPTLWEEAGRLLAALRKAEAAS